MTTKKAVFAAFFVISFFSFLVLVAGNLSAKKPAPTLCALPSGDSEDLTVSSYFSGLLSTDKWPARWTCGEWSETEGWLYIGADFSIFLAYFIIPILLIWYAFRQSRGIARRVMFFFSAFIIFCGFTHLIDVVLFWEPMYRLSGFVKLLTAIISLSAVFVFGVAIPRLLTFRSPEDLQLEIDQRKRIQHQFETLMKFSPSAIAMLDTEMRYLLVNDQWKNLIAGGDIVGQSYKESFPQLGDHTTWNQDITEVLEGKQIPVREDHFIKDGEPVHFERKIESWKHESGEIGGFIIFIDDISAVVAQRKTENKYALLIRDISETAGIGVWNFNVESNEIFFNDHVYEIHGILKGEKLSADLIASFYHPEDWRKIQEASSESMQTGKPWNLELRLTDTNGTEKWIRTVGKAVIGKGQVLDIQGMIEDITERRNSQEKLNDSAEKLQESIKALESFSYSISHDLRAPLRAINGFSKALMEDFTDDLPEDASRYMSRIMANSQKMGNLIDDLLEFSRLNRKKAEFDQVNTADLMQRIISELFQKESKYIHASALPVIYADKAMVTQVFTNLLSNAIKYSSKKPDQKIIISSRKERDGDVIIFTDNGIGFNMEYYNKLFGVFQRLHSESEYAGTGVGLSIVKRIMDAHQGEVWAESVEGKGATFLIKFKKKNK